MAYATTNPPALISQRVGASNGAVWFYSDGDTLADVLAASYFTNGDDLGMEDGDKVIFYDETNDIQYDLLVDGVVAGGAVTVRPAANSIGAVTTVSTAATYAIAAQESGTTFLLAKADGIVFTLPSCAVGLSFKFLVTAAVTSNAYSVDCTTGDFFVGLLNLGAEDGAADAFGGDGTSDLSIDMNGGTKGGLIGSEIEVIGVSASKWHVRGSLLGTGTVATPFSTS